MVADRKLTGSPVISAEKVEGTAVYDRSANRLGTVEDLILDKISGRTIYAIMSFGGFMGLGEKHYPLPWSTLTYDTKLEGYVVDLRKEQLTDAPSYEPQESIDWTPDYGQQVDRYWNVPSQWPRETR